MSLELPGSTLADAMKHPNWNRVNGYRYAAIRELKAWVKHAVLQDKGAAPSTANLLNLRFLWSCKTDKKGLFSRAKLRIIVLGHKWAAKHGEHWFENHSHTVHWPNLRTCMAQACLEKFTIAKQWDAHAAFLLSDNEPGAECYARVDQALQEVLGLSTDVAFVAKAAYGLPSAPRGFNKYAKKILEDTCGLKSCPHDEAVFKLRRGNSFIFVCTWVDDYAVFSNDEALYNEVRDKYFGSIEGDEGPLEYLLGVNVDVDPQQHTIKIYSEKAIRGLLQKYGEPRHPSAVPAHVSMADLADQPLPEIGSPLHQNLRERAVRYRSLTHAILYNATTTRPDIAYACGVLTRAQDNPTEGHLEALDVLLAYLQNTITHGIVYSPNGDVANLTVEYSGLKDGLLSLSDSNWSSGKSLSGYVIFLAGGPVLWTSKLQPVTSLSSAEAEYYAGSSCGAATVALRLFLSDIDALPLFPTIVFIDNSATVDLAKDFKSFKRAKHIDRRVNFLTDYQDLGEVEVVHIGTSINTADVFTKPLSKPEFLKHASALVKP